MPWQGGTSGAEKPLNLLGTVSAGDGSGSIVQHPPGPLPAAPGTPSAKGSTGTKSWVWRRRGEGPVAPQCPQPWQGMAQGRVWGCPWGSQITQPGTPIRREGGGTPRAGGRVGHPWGLRGSQGVGRAGGHSCGDVPCVLPVFPHNPQCAPCTARGKMGEKSWKQSLAPDSCWWGQGPPGARAPRSVPRVVLVAQRPHGDPWPGTRDSSTMATTCPHPWGGLVTPCPSGLWPWQCRGPGPVRSRAPGSGGAEGPLGTHLRVRVPHAGGRGDIAEVVAD